MLFPNLTNFHPNLKKTILERAGNNQYVSTLIPWIRVTASTGLVLESVPPTDSFEDRYGFNKDGITRSGKVGNDLNGSPVYADGNDRMFRPSPVIEGLGVNFGTGGLTRKCQFAIKCFTLAQAEKVMEYFMEPGYTVLIEFGWNANESVNQKINLNDICSIVSFNSYDITKQKQSFSNFTYEGFLGYITNGGFKSGDGETFNIEVELTSLGEPAAYLQQHRGANKINDNQNPGGKIFTNSDIDNTTDVGTALFKQMFNRLPKSKQIDEVKNLITRVDSMGTPYSHEGNYINMDDVIRERLVDELKGTSVASEAGGAEIPDGTPLVSESTFIRLELAFEILNACSLRMPTIKGKCDVGTFPFKIEYKDTIIRAHKHLFSADPSKLFIPNPLTPDFGLVETLTSKKEGESYPILNDDGLKSGLPRKTIDLNQFKDKGNEYSFPQQVPLSDSGYKWKVDTIQFDAESGQWGYLKDLFINFEFFISVLEKSNYVAKDVYYEMLNGLSVGANSIWHFDIVQIPAYDTNEYHLEVVDLNFCGNITESETKFRFSGVDSPFITSNLSFDIPASMKNMIVAERMGGDIKDDPSSEGNLSQRLWSTNVDPVLEEISNFQKAVDKYVEDEQKKLDEKSNKTTNTTSAKPKKLSEKEIRKQNYELFMSKACVLPMIKDRNGDIDAAKNKFLEFFKEGISTNNTLEGLVAVGAWQDSSLFRKLDTNTRNSFTPNNVLLEITFDFTIHGVSGIKTGDLFEIEDLPQKYKNTLFQVVEVSHGLDSNQWLTSVTGKMRKKDQLEQS
jgi:hypothetical protein